MTGVELLVALAFGVVCAWIAKAKNRNMAGWFFGGFFTGFISLLVLAFRPHTDKLEKSDTWTVIGLHVAIIVGIFVLAVIVVAAASAGVPLT